MSFVSQIFWINLILFLWFNTDAFISYCKLFRLNKLFKLNDFDDYKVNNPKADYLNFPRIKHTSFIVELFTCKPCFCFWVVLIDILLFSSLINLATIYLLSYISYKILNKYVY